jgi:hypothetical protein
MKLFLTRSTRLERKGKTTMHKVGTHGWLKTYMMLRGKGKNKELKRTVNSEITSCFSMDLKSKTSWEF